MIRIVLADDHRLVREGIRALIESGTDAEVVGEADNGVEALQLVESLRPELLILDLTMPRMNGLQVLERVREKQPDLPVIVLSMHNDPGLIKQVLRLGARGYLLKDDLAEELNFAMKSVSLGNRYFSPSILTKMKTLEKIPDSLNPVEGLTPREREVFQMIVEGNSNQEIASALVISIKTVEKHRANLMGKLGAGDLATLLRIAIKFNYLNIDDPLI